MTRNQKRKGRTCEIQKKSFFSKLIILTQRFVCRELFLEKVFGYDESQLYTHSLSARSGMLTSSRLCAIFETFAMEWNFFCSPLFSNGFDVQTNQSEFEAQLASQHAWKKSKLYFTIVRGQSRNKIRTGAGWQGWLLGIIEEPPRVYTTVFFGRSASLARGQNSWSQQCILAKERPWLRLCRAQMHAPGQG